ncbi:ketopantoate reductase family protein [Candidatus Sumerlaeota bacterium]|nr:ketopantoate reductase family protein [Candidatus Sumerlaeota bacterium]
MNILIFGAGAIGSVFGGYLNQANHTVWLVGRRDHMMAVREQGLLITGIWGEKRIRLPHAVTQTSEIPRNITFDAIIISVKSYDTREAACQIAPLVKEETLVVSLQNGIGNVETIADCAGWDHTVGGRVIFGVEFHAPGEVEVTVYAEEVMLGHPKPSPLSEKTRSLAIEIDKSGIPTKYTEEISKYIWAKLLYNAALNPLSSLLQVPYGYLAKRQETRLLMEQIVSECFCVANSHETPLFWEKDADYMKVLTGRLIPATAEHHPSMLQDIRKGKPTEIDAINGAIVSLGKKSGVPTPVNETIANLIHALEKR